MAKARYEIGTFKRTTINAIRAEWRATFPGIRIFSDKRHKSIYQTQETYITVKLYDIPNQDIANQAVVIAAKYGVGAIINNYGKDDNRMCNVLIKCRYNNC